MKNIIIGNVHKYGNDINTDVIIPSRYYWNTLNSDENRRMAKRYTMIDIDPEFVKNVKEGDIIVAGDNFGCGSSRENAATCFVALGISIIIAKSFAHIFYRNAINNGLLVITSNKAFDLIDAGDSIEVNMEENIINNIFKKIKIPFFPINKNLLEILNEGGLINYSRKKLNII